MPSTKFTKAAIDRIALTPGRQTIIWDTELAGFGMMVGGTKKTFLVQRRMPDGRSKRVVIGAVGEFARVEDARAKAGGVLQQLRGGEDPLAERRRTAVRDRTLREWAELYIGSRRDLRPKSVTEYRRAVDRYMAAWATRPLATITGDDVERLHQEVGRKFGAATANGVMRTLRAIWNFAAERDSALPACPTKRLKKTWFRVEARRGMVAPADLPRFWRAASELENAVMADYVRFVLLTGMRRTEAAALRWDEVDLVGRVIRLPPERNKAGRAFDLPMSDLVHGLLVRRRAPGVSRGGWVFPANSRSGHVEEPKFALDLIEKATGTCVSVHDLRRTFTTVAESCEISPFALRALVNHSLGRSVTEGYIQMSTERLRGPAQKVADRFRELCEIEALPEGVVALRKPLDVPGALG
jgi:integrase